MRVRATRLGAAVCAGALAGCGWSSGQTVDKIGQGDSTQIPARYASVISDGCTPDAWQNSALGSPDTRRFVREVVLMCAVPRAEGKVGPGDPSARAQLAQTVDGLRTQGYTVKLGVSFQDEAAERYDGAQTASLLASSTWRSAIVSDLVTLAGLADGVDLDLQKLPESARGDLTAFVQTLDGSLGGGKKIALLAPPSTQEPSDTPGGGAFDLAALALYVDRVRVMTLDFSDPNPGPTVDPGWAVDAVRFTRSKVGALPVDVAMPLYGNDVSDLGTRSVGFFEATGIAADYHVDVQRGALDNPHFQYTDGAGHAHQIWYDDADSTSRTLRAWDPGTLPMDVGVVFYGLGAEDPAVWPTIARGLP